MPCKSLIRTCALVAGVSFVILLSAQAGSVSAQSAGTGHDLVRHVVLFALKADITPEQRKVIEETSAELRKEVTFIRGYEWGTDLNQGQRAQGYTHCVVMTFDGPDDLKKYLVHPAHVAFKEKAMPYIEKMLVFDFQPEHSLNQQP